MGLRPPVVGVHMDMLGKLTAVPTSDGRMLQATVAIPGNARRGVILLHMAGGSRNDYRQLQERLYNLGIGSIAVNFRGNNLYGGTSGTPEDAKLYVGLNYTHFQTFYKDAAACREYLVRQGIPDECIAVVGGSVGSSTALKYGAMNPKIPVVVLLSPGLGYFGIDSRKDMIKYGNRPIYMMYATKANGEKYTVDALTRLHPDPSKVTKDAIEGGFWGAHATLAFYADPSLIDRIANYLDKQLSRC